ncbi:phosphoesterase PA-phosphatase [Actinoplanes sp. NPDC051859]|uniref:phosphoesterase PA-phosphatase n=1 Tax=Actinoplanes sp. NPDC051859 TaxID=3363909 RepID=UPI0037A8EEA3
MPTLTDAPTTVATPTRLRLAKLITDVLSPAVLVALLTLTVAWNAAAGLAQALTVGLIAAAAGSFIPIAYILRGVRKGRWTDKHVRVRAQRKLPILACLISTVLGTVVLYLVDAPRQLIALIIAMVASLAVAAPVTVLLRWKISVHALVAAGTTAALTVIFGPFGLVTAPVAVAVCWSRVVLRDHTLLQVIGGTIVGTAAMTFLFPVLS